MSVTLFDFPDNVYSHPGEYPLKTHVSNIAESFDDPVHKKAAFCHDLGKLNRAFQANINRGGPLPFHAHAGAFFFLVYAGMAMDHESFGVFLSILKHHGDLPDVQTLADDLMDDETISHDHPELADSIQQIQKVLGIRVAFDLEDICELFDHESFVLSYGLTGLSSYFRIKEIFSRLIFADKYEAIFKDRFEEGPDMDFDRSLNSLSQLIRGKANELSTVRNEARTDVMASFAANHEKRIFFLEAPTGIGKTFTSLQLALTIAKQKNKKRVICALPMTSIIDQTYMEYAKIIEESILLKFHHLTRTKSYLDGDREIENECSFHGQKNEFLAASWSQDRVIVTTFNQILNAIFSHHNRDLVKFWTLKDSVIIFDEIQAIPRILLRDFAQTIQFLTQALNMDVILMSATIPALKPLLPQNTWCNLLNERYYAMDFNNRYALEFDRTINTPEKLVDRIHTAADQYGSILCVVNTKKLALDIYEHVLAFAKEDEVYLLSTLFIPKHRKRIIKTIRKRLAKGLKTVLISTQVIEAGVDLDFDFGFREFAPLYSIIQTAGRINRENREDVRETATLIVTNQIGNSPYHDNDLLYNDVSRLLETPIRENEILPRLKSYFDTAINQTCPDPVLINDMKQLKFQTVMQTFDKNFMKTLPNMSSVFIEIKAGLYERFVNKRNRLIEQMKQDDLPLEHIMEIKSRLKQINKHVSAYIISVSQDDVSDLPDFENYNGVKVCQYSRLEAGIYTQKKGWSGSSETLLF